MEPLYPAPRPSIDASQGEYTHSRNAFRITENEHDSLETNEDMRSYSSEKSLYKIDIHHDIQLLQLQTSSIASELSLQEFFHSQAFRAAVAITKSPFLPDSSIGNKFACLKSQPAHRDNGKRY